MSDTNVDPRLRESFRQYTAALGHWGWSVIGSFILGEALTAAAFFWSLQQAPIPQEVKLWTWGVLSVCIAILVAAPFFAFHKLRVDSLYKIDTLKTEMDDLKEQLSAQPQPNPEIVGMKFGCEKDGTIIKCESKIANPTTRPVWNAVFTFGACPFGKPELFELSTPVTWPGRVSFGIGVSPRFRVACGTSAIWVYYRAEWSLDESNEKKVIAENWLWVNSKLKDPVYNMVQEQIDKFRPFVQDKLLSSKPVPDASGAATSSETATPSRATVEMFIDEKSHYREDGTFSIFKIGVRNSGEVPAESVSARIVDVTPISEHPSEEVMARSQEARGMRLQRTHHSGVDCIAQLRLDDTFDFVKTNAMWMDRQGIDLCHTTTGFGERIGGMLPSAEYKFTLRLEAHNADPTEWTYVVRLDQSGRVRVSEPDLGATAADRSPAG